jgi:hypothetical protein
MTTRLSSCFPADRAALVTFITAGDGDTADLSRRGDKDIISVSVARGIEI